MRDALTRSEAAKLLGVSPSRISQLLADGTLTGPTHEEGVRAQKNAPRVWRSSAEDWASNPQNRKPGRPRRSPDGGEPATDYLELQHEVSRLRARERTLRDVAQQLKAMADHNAERLDDERAARASAELEVVKLRLELSALREALNDKNASLTRYSDVATSFLSPDSLGDAL